MTSKNLYFSLLKEELKRKIWALALCTLVCFFAFPVAVSLMMSSVSLESYTMESLTMDLARWFSYNNGFMAVIAITAAIICGLSVFSYLNSKKKVDLYHALPIKRSLLFAVNYTCGILLFMVPYVANVILAGVIVWAQGYGMALQGAAAGILVTILFFLLIYSTVLVAVMLTGNIVISFLGMNVFFFYAPAVIALKVVYYDMFYHTVSHFGNGMDLVKYTSPIMAYFNSVMGYISPAKMGVVFGITLALTAFSFYLYGKRPSEAAGKTIAFQVAKPLIKFPLVVLAALAGGILFKGISYRQGFAWFAFGALCGLFICHCVIEIIYKFDFKAILSNKRDMVICGIIVACISVVFIFDLTNYDEYLPSIDKIESVSISINDIDDHIFYREYKKGERGRDYLAHIDSDEYRLKNMVLSSEAEIQSVLNMAKSSITGTGGDTIDLNGEESENSYTSSVYIKYTLKNGKEVHRRHHIDLVENRESVNTILESLEYKTKVNYDLYPMQDTEVKKVEIYNILGMNQTFFDETLVKELLNAYKEDLLKLNLETLEKEMPIGEIQFTSIADLERLEKDNPSDIRNRYPIYPSFEQTLRVLVKYQIPMQTSLTAENIEKIIVRVEDKTYYDEHIAEVMIDEKSATADIYDQKDTRGPEITYTDKEQIRKLLGSGIQSSYTQYNQIYLLERAIEIRIYTNQFDEYGRQIEINMFFSKDQIPDFIKEDFKNWK